MNMGALTHPDIVATRVDSDEEDNADNNADNEEDETDPNSQQSQLSTVSQLTQRSAASHIANKKLTRADLVILAQGSNVYNGFNFTGDITSQVFDKCQEQHNRLSGQRADLKKRREEQHRSGLDQITIVGKLSSGAFNREGIISPNDPAAIELILSRSQQNIKNKKKKAASSQEKLYKSYVTGRGTLEKWEESQQEKSTVKLTSSEYECLLRFKMMGRCKEEKDKIPTLVGERKTLWYTKWKDEVNPLQPVKPKTKTKSTATVPVDTYEEQEVDDREFEQLLEDVRKKVQNGTMDNNINNLAQV